MRFIFPFFDKADFAGVPSRRLLRPIKNFEVTIDRAVGEEVRGDGACGVELWPALVGIQWHAANGAVVSYKFANEGLKADFLQRVRERNIAPTILSNPPSKQILNGSTLAWEGKAAPKNIQDFIGAVRRVRNNLVHGGKSGDPDADRNAILVSEAIEVLLEALRSHDDLRVMFEGKW